MYLQAIRDYNNMREEEAEVDEEMASPNEDEFSDESMEAEIREILQEAENLEKEMQEMSCVCFEGMTRLPCCAHKVLKVLSYHNICIKLKCKI